MEYLKFTTLLEAWQFIAIVNAGEGYPIDGTITYCTPEKRNGEYYIKNDSVIEKYSNLMELHELPNQED